VTVVGKADKSQVLKKAKRFSCRAKILEVKKGEVAEKKVEEKKKEEDPKKKEEPNTCWKNDPRNLYPTFYPLIHILLLFLLHLNLMAFTDLAKLTLFLTTRTQKLIAAITITQTIHTISLTSDTLELQLQSPKTVHTISLISNTLELFSLSLCSILQSRSQVA
jgi:hypothetical protein